MTKAERTRAFIIETAAKLFNKAGYAAVSLSDITDATGLSKGSIYGNFENKEEIMLAAYKHHATRISNRIKATSAGGGDPIAKLLETVEYYRANWRQLSGNGGCPLMNTAIEADDCFPQLKAGVAGSFRQWANSWTKLLKTGQQEGRIVESIDPASYAYQFIAMIEGGVLLARTLDQPQLLFDNLDRIREIVQVEIAA